VRAGGAGVAALVLAALCALVTVTIGAGVSESGAPIQRTISPLE